MKVAVNVGLICLQCFMSRVVVAHAAERHAGCSCVTASMDDIHFEHTIR